MLKQVVRTFNRTSLELKLQNQQAHLRRCGSFNRTSLELKLLLNFVSLISIFTFNRTSFGIETGS